MYSSLPKFPFPCATSKPPDGSRNQSQLKGGQFQDSFACFPQPGMALWPSSAFQLPSGALEAHVDGSHQTAH